MGIPEKRPLGHNIQRSGVADHESWLENRITSYGEANARLKYGAECTRCAQNAQES